MRTRLIGLVGLAAVVVAACGAGDPGVTATKSRSGGGGGLFPTDTTVPGGTSTSEPTYDVIPGVVDFGSNKTPRDYDGFLTAAFGDIENFWSKAYPEAYGEAWTPLQGGVYAAYPERTEPIPACDPNGGSATYDDVYSRGAYYCRIGDYMAYDDASLLPDLVNQLGKEAVAIVLAHEFGHAVQFRANEFDQPVILKEQQADCFAGAWTAHVASGGSDLIRFNDADVRSGLIAMINVRDPVEGNGLDDPDAHGTGFDRVGAFQDGFVGGVTRCATFFTEDRVSQLIDIKFDPSDPNAGNLPLIDPNPDPTNGPADIETLIPASLDFFWVALAQANNVPFTKPTFTAFSANALPTCDGVDQGAFAGNATFCPADNTIYWDQDTMQSLATDPLTGDMSVGYLFSDAYSDAIQYALHSQATGEPRVLRDDCLTGAWVASIVPERADQNSPITLSAGDLDEAIITAIGRSDATADTNVNGSAFEKVDAFRAGVLGGLNVCRTYGG